jgi:hypothetical protein
MLDPDPNPEPECITVPVPQHWILFQCILAQAVNLFRRLNFVCFKTPSDFTLPSFAPKDFIPSLFFVR